MSLWKIRRQNTMFVHPNEGDVCYGPRWCVYSPNGVSWGTYTTWAEAMKRADTQARTVTVTLPRYSYRAGSFFLVGGLHGTTVHVLHENDPDQRIVIPPDTLKPLALALLTKHHKQDQAYG